MYLLITVCDRAAIVRPHHPQLKLVTTDISSMENLQTTRDIYSEELVYYKCSHKTKTYIDTYSQTDRETDSS